MNSKLDYIKIARRMEELGIGPVELAAKMNRSPSTVSSQLRRVRNRLPMRNGTKKRLADALGVTIAELKVSGS